jgi:serine/threonine-protein kinase
MRHPNIAAVYGSAVHEQQPYVVSEHVRGCSALTVLVASVTARRALSPAFAAYVASEVAIALEYAHRFETEDRRPLELVHRAVSPVNIRLGERGSVRLTNFGAVFTTLPGRFVTPPKSLRGDPAYMAPEIAREFLRPQSEGEGPPTARGFDARADLFSLGLVLLEMLTATHPLNPPQSAWQGMEARFPTDVRAERPSFLPLEVLANRVLHFGPEQVRKASAKVPAPLRAVLTRALCPDPDKRYQSAGMMRAELLRYLGGLKRPYGRAEAADESSLMLKEAAEAGMMAAYPGVERGVLPARRDKVDDDEEIH